MAKILILTPQLPYPPEQGTSLRNFHIIRGLSARHQISLLSFATSPHKHDGPPESHLLDLCSTVETVPLPRRSPMKRIRQAIGGRNPDMALRLHGPAFLSSLTRMLKQNHFDIVQVEGLELAFTISTIRIASPHSRIVYDAHNAETELQRRAFQTDLRNPRRWHAAAYSWLQVGRLRRFETWACERADWITAVSDPDRIQLQALASGSQFPITVIPNTIDVGPYQEIADGAIGAQAQGSAGSEEARRWDLVFIGKMDYRPNVDAVLWFADTIWPLVRARRTNATWAIVGQKPHTRLDRLRGKDGLTITGRVESVLPFLAGASICIMPFRMGSGTRLKLIEAMAAGKAIVSTSIGAEGFPVSDGRELRLADDAEGTALAIVQLLDNPEQREQLGREALKLAKRYDWRQVIPKFDGLYQRLLLDKGSDW